MFARGLRGIAWSQLEDGLQFLQKLAAAIEAVEVFERAVIGKDLQLTVREDDAEERRAAASALSGVEDARGGGGAMMAVGDVKARDVGENGLNLADGGFVANGPGGMLDAVRGGEIDVRRSGGFAGGEVVHFFDGAIGQKDFAGLG